MRPHRTSLLSILPVLPLPMVIGCAGTVSGGGDGVDAEAATKTSALVSIERNADANGSRAEASARFLRVLGAASPDDALQAIGAALELPAAGACAALSSHPGVVPAQLPRVELIDVGAVGIVASGVETRLSPRQLPDVTDVVSGVVYARGTDPALLPDGARYFVRVAGGPELEAFTVSALAAGSPDEVRVSGEGEEGTLVASGANVELTWPARASDDVVYVDVRPADVRCTLGDGGRGSVSTLLFDDAGSLVVHRLRREALRARGVDSGEIRFDFARTIAYVRR
jgi:hypothetical protein